MLSITKCLWYHFKFDRTKWLCFCGFLRLRTPCDAYCEPKEHGYASQKRVIVDVFGNFTGRSWGHTCQEKKITDFICNFQYSTRVSSSLPSFSRSQLCHTAPTQIIFSPLSPFNNAFWHSCNIKISTLIKRKRSENRKQSLTEGEGGSLTLWLKWGTDGHITLVISLKG